MQQSWLRKRRPRFALPLSDYSSVILFGNVPGGSGCVEEILAPDPRSRLSSWRAMQKTRCVKSRPRLASPASRRSIAASGEGGPSERDVEADFSSAMVLGNVSGGSGFVEEISALDPRSRLTSSQAVQQTSPLKGRTRLASPTSPCSSATSDEACPSESNVAAGFSSTIVIGKVLGGSGGVEGISAPDPRSRLTSSRAVQQPSPLKGRTRLSLPISPRSIASSGEASPSRCSVEADVSPAMVVGKVPRISRRVEGILAPDSRTRRTSPQASSRATRRPQLSLPITPRSGEASPCTRNDEAAFASAISLGEAIGSGAFAEVKRAWRRDNGSVLAVKCICSEDFQHRRLANEEFEMLRSITCPAVVSAFELYECGGSIYLCLELCNAGDVCSYVKAKGPFFNASAPSLFGQVLRGVRYIHTKRIVHCDIKHENLLLHESEAGLIIKLADFNSAQRLGHRSRAVPMSSRVTKSFCAPEVTPYGDWNERVDIWSCGLCFYFMMYGCLPFDLSSSDTSRQLLAGRLPYARWDRSDTMSTHLMKQCLTVDGRERPPALELVQHSLFFAKSYDKAGVACAAGVLRPFCAHLPSCGSIFIRDSTGHAPSALPDNAGLQSSTKVVPVLRSSHFLNVPVRFRTYERCFRDVDQAFEQLAYVKFMRSVNGDGFDSWTRAHTHY